MIEQVRVWLSQPGNLPLVQTTAIVAGLLFNGLGFFVAAWVFLRNRKLHLLSFLTDLTSSHRDIWKLTIESPELARVTSKEPDLIGKPITPEERRLLNLAILNMALAFEAHRLGIYRLPQGSKRDMAAFLQLPIPKRVWADMREYQDRRFVRFIERKVLRT